MSPVAPSSPQAGVSIEDDQIASLCSGSLHFDQQQTNAASGKKLPVRCEAQRSTCLMKGEERVLLILWQKAA